MEYLLPEIMRNGRYRYGAKIWKSLRRIDILKEVKKKRGRPREEGSKKKGIFIRADDALCEELKELSALEGITQADYIRDAIKMRANLTRATKGNT